MELVFGMPIYQAGESRNIQNEKNTSIEKQQSEEGGQKSPKQLSEYIYSFHKYLGNSRENSKSLTKECQNDFHKSLPINR